MTKSTVDRHKVEQALKRAGRIALTGSAKERSGSVLGDKPFQIGRDSQSGKFVTTRQSKKKRKALGFSLKSQ